MSPQWHLSIGRRRRLMFLPDLWRLNDSLVTWFWDRGSYRAALSQAKAYTRLRPHDANGWVTRYHITDELLGGDDGEVVLIAGLRRNPDSVHLLHLHVTGLVRMVFLRRHKLSWTRCVSCTQIPLAP